MATSPGFAETYTSAEVDEEATYAVNSDGVRLEIAQYEFPKTILANSTSQNVRYSWRACNDTYLIADDRENAEPEHGHAQFLEVGKIVSGDQPDQHLFKNMNPEKSEKKAWKCGSKFVRDPKALPVFLKYTKYLAPKAIALVGYRRDANTGLLDLAAVDIDCVFLYSEILTTEILNLPVRSRISKMRASAREFAAEHNMQDPHSVPKVPIVKSTTDTTSKWSTASVSDLENVVNKSRMMFEVWKNNKSDPLPLQGILKLIEQKLGSEHQGPDMDMLNKFVEDDSDFSLEDVTRFQHELKVCRCAYRSLTTTYQVLQALYPQFRPIDLSFTQALHTAIHKQHLADTIPKRDVIFFLEHAHVSNEDADDAADVFVRAETIAPRAAKQAASSSNVASWSFPRPKEYDSDTTRAHIQHLYAILVRSSAITESLEEELQELFGGVRAVSWPALSKQIGAAIDRKSLQSDVSQGMAVMAEMVKALYVPGAGNTHDVVRIMNMMMKN